MNEEIIDSSEKRVRHAGYSNMCFRDVAKDVGIKSASVHYHFPTKSDLGTALVERYKDHFSQKLLQIEPQTSPTPWQNLFNFMMPRL